MGDSGWWPIIAFVTLVNPVVIISGILTGLVVRNWGQAAVGLVTAPAAYWLYASAFMKNDHFGIILPALAVAGGIWTAATFALKKAAS